MMYCWITLIHFMSYQENAILSSSPGEGKEIKKVEPPIREADTKDCRIPINWCQCFVKNKEYLVSLERNIDPNVMAIIRVIDGGIGKAYNMKCRYPNLHLIIMSEYKEAKSYAKTFTSSSFDNNYVIYQY